MKPDPLPDSQARPAAGPIAPGSGNMPASATSAPPVTTQPRQTPAVLRSPHRHHWLRRIISLLLLSVLVVGGIGVWLQHNFLLDWALTYNYQPPASVQQLASQTALTPYAKRLFYVNRPAIEDKAAFNNHCSSQASKEVAVLGCFRGDRRGIYIYNVTDTRLQGIEQVTAAHEMLHQAYVRLNNADKNRIDALLEQYAATLPAGELKDKINTYRKTEPGQVVNEMHSVFGTEAADLPAALETYYQRYFTDRRQVLTYEARYRAAFETRTKQIAAYDTQLTTLRATIDADKTDIAAREKALKTERSRLDALTAASRIDEYNASVPAFNTQVVAYKQKVADANATIAEYNDIIDKRNAIAVEEQDLLKAQDSHAATAAQQ